MSRYVLSPRAAAAGSSASVLRYTAVPRDHEDDATPVEATVLVSDARPTSPRLRRRSSADEAQMPAATISSPRAAPVPPVQENEAEVALDPLEDASGNLRIRILDLNGKVFDIHAAPVWPVATLKSVVRNKSGVEEGRQRLIYRGRVLEDEMTLGDAKLEDGHTVHLFVRQVAAPPEPDFAATSSSAAPVPTFNFDDHAHQIHFGANETITSAVFPSESARRMDPLMLDSPLGIAARRVKLWASFILIINTMKLLGEFAFLANLRAMHAQRNVDESIEKMYKYSPLYDSNSYVTAAKLFSYAWGVYVGCVGFKAAHDTDLRPIRTYVTGIAVLAVFSVTEQAYEIFHFSQWDPVEYEQVKAKTQMYAQQKPSLDELIRSSIIQTFLLAIMWCWAVRHAVIHKEEVAHHNSILAAAAMSAVPLPPLESIAAGNIEDRPAMVRSTAVPRAADDAGEAPPRQPQAVHDMYALAMPVAATDVLDVLAGLRDSTRGDRPPTVLIAGPMDAGKSTLARAVLWHALESWPDEAVAFVDLDVGQGDLGVPGCVGATVLTQAALQKHDDILADGAAQKYPLALRGGVSYFVGDISLAAVPNIFKVYASELAQGLKAQRRINPALTAAVVNTCGWIDDLGYRLLLHAAQSFAVDAVVVLGSHGLYDRLLQDLSPSTQLLSLPRAPEAARRSTAARRSARDDRFRMYFAPAGVLTELTVDAASITFLRLRGDRGRRLAVVKAALLVDKWLRQVVAVLRAPPTALSRDALQAYWLRAPAIGYVCIHAIDKQLGTVTLLTPRPGPLPSLTLLGGSNAEWLP
ncbi:ubiquitin family protein [Achlya hypogyna]|uniref:Ubiquitin family protein n=1 Tax=Achlya hypogyna TaxID=1202772 RepID=A0A1V9YL37_ACHHY|nr:ubiquitin family protein [Achlya hypogyna]